MSEHSPLIQIPASGSVWAVAFMPNGDYLVGGGHRGVRVWRVKDGKQIAAMTVDKVFCLAVSNDGRFIAAGTSWGEVAVWDPKTYSSVFNHQEGNKDFIRGVHFSPDSTRLVVASANGKVTVWDVATRRQVHVLPHAQPAIAARYSPRGDRIATATQKSVRVYDSNDGHLLVDVPVAVTPHYNAGLLWRNSQLFVLSDNKIKHIHIEASTGSTFSEWFVPSAKYKSCIALPRHGQFIAYSTSDAVTFWDASRHHQLGVIQHSHEILSIALSPDGRFLAICGQDGKVIINSLFNIIDSIPLSRLHPTFQEPYIYIDEAVLHSWKQDLFVEAEALLSATLPASQEASAHALAGRALVRARLRKWDAAIEDAEQSIRYQPSVIGYIAKSIAHISKGDRHGGYRACDIAFENFHSRHVSFLLLMKAIIVFMAGDYEDAISRLDELIATVSIHSTCYMVLAYMHFLVGNFFMESGDYTRAIQSFGTARTQLYYRGSRSLLLISLITGWKFDNLDMDVRQCLCEALLIAGRAKEAGEAVLEMTCRFHEEVYASEPISNWISDITRRCLTTFESDVNSTATRGNNGRTIRDLPPTLPLLKVWVKATLAYGSWRDALVTALHFKVPRTTIYQAVCEHMESIDWIADTHECLQQMERELVGEGETCIEAKWVLDLKLRCADKLVILGDTAAIRQQHDEAIAQFSAALSLYSIPPLEVFIKRGKAYMAKGLWEYALEDSIQVTSLDRLASWSYESVLLEWAKVELASDSWRNALASARRFNAPRVMIYRALCECLETVGRILEASECFHEMTRKLVQDLDGRDAEWVLNFKSRCCKKLEDLGDTEVNSRQYDTAALQYSSSLSLDPTSTSQTLLARQGRACTTSDLGDDAVRYADVTRSDSLSPADYEGKYATPRGAGHHDDTVNAFDIVCSASKSSSPETSERSRKYVRPTQTQAVIRAAIENAIRGSPLILINTVSGRLLDKSGQVASFELQPIYEELIFSDTTRSDQARIDHEAERYYRYTTFSHKWEENEPLFDKVIHGSVYDLEESPTHNKLKMFCKTAREAGFHWAWSDTCCIDRTDHFVLQEALVSMFKWYQGSSMTIVHLRGVRSPSNHGDLIKSVWNTRAWTFQEYHASKTIQFYNEDWTLYRNIDLPNHKESPEVISEMEEATGVSARALMALQPGLDDIREKLRLASTRQTTRVEDAAYSLLGIFSMSLPVVYGEGDKALGRLLAQLLMSSGDTSILAWTGRSGSFNSCLPADISVFQEQPKSHIPWAIEETRMERAIAGLRNSLLNINSVFKLYDRLYELPVTLFAGQRMKLPCITFPLGPVSATSGSVFRAKTDALGIVEIKTPENLSRLGSLILVHPWIDFLLDRQPVGGVADVTFEEYTDDHSTSPGSSKLVPSPVNGTLAKKTRTSRIAARLGLPFGARQNRVSLISPTPLSPADRQLQALRLVARLRQPFGALLFAPTRQNSAEYRRVAAESMITVRVQPDTPMNVLIDNARMLDVL